MPGPNQLALQAARLSAARPVPRSVPEGEVRVLLFRDGKADVLAKFVGDLPDGFQHFGRLLSVSRSGEAAVLVTLPGGERMPLRAAWDWLQDEGRAVAAVERDAKAVAEMLV